MINERFELVDFSYPLGSEGCTILSAKRIHKYINDLGYLKLVDYYVWIAIVITFVLIIIQNIFINKSLSNFIDNLFCAFRMMIRAGEKQNQIFIIKLMINIKMNFSEIIMKNKQIAKASIYLIILMVYVFHLNLNARYNVSLVITESDNEIDSLEKLALRKEVIPTARKGTSKEQYFKVS